MASTMSETKLLPPEDPVIASTESLPKGATVDDTGDRNAGSSSSSSSRESDTTDSSPTTTGSGEATTSSSIKKPKRKSKGRVYKCTGFPNCSMTFTRSEHLARHIRKHTGERPFKCDHCLKRFSRLDNLRQHKQTVHMYENFILTYPGEKVNVRVKSQDALDSMEGSGISNSDGSRGLRRRRPSLPQQVALPQQFQQGQLGQPHTPTGLATNYSPLLSPPPSVPPRVTVSQPEGSMLPAPRRRNLLSRAYSEFRPNGPHKPGPIAIPQSGNTPALITPNMGILPTPLSASSYYAPSSAVSLSPVTAISPGVAAFSNPNSPYGPGPSPTTYYGSLPSYSPRGGFMPPFYPQQQQQQQQQQLLPAIYDSLRYAPAASQLPPIQSSVQSIAFANRYSPLSAVSTASSPSSNQRGHVVESLGPATNNPQPSQHGTKIWLRNVLNKDEQ